MSIDELLELMKNEKATPESIKAFQERQRKREEEYKRQHKPITEAWLNRQYNI